MEHSVPGSDSAGLTAEQLYRELLALRELLQTRLDDMDKATSLLNENMTRVPTEVDKQIAHLKELHGEKFVSVQRQFEERDVRARASEAAANTAVNAALQAQKEAAGAQNESNAAAITKSEAATVKQIEGINMLLASNSKSLDEKIGTISARLDRGDGSASGVATRQATMLTVAALGIAALMAGYAIFHGSAQPQIVVSPPTSISAPAK